MKSLFKATTTVGSMTLLSRILGFVRDMVIAQLFGASAGADAFFVAFKIPNFMRRLFAEGAFSQAFVPVFSEYRGNRTRAESRDFAGGVSGTLGAVMLAITVLGVLGAPLLVTIFAPGFLSDTAKFDLTVDMLRITFPYLFLIAMTAYAGAILNAHGQFAVPAFTPVLLNVVMIVAGLAWAPLFDVPTMALAWGVFVAGVAQLLFQLPSLYRLGMLAPPRWRWRDSGVQRVIKLMGPAVFGSSVAQINLLIDTLLASFLVTGSVSWLYYSDRLVEFPLGVLGLALATVILPRLSAQHAGQSNAAFAATLDWALRWVMLIATPAMFALFVLAGPILVSLFQYGEFSADDARMATLSLMAYALGLLGFVLVKVLAPGFYARQDTRTPVRIGIVSMVWNMVLNVAFVLPLVMFDIPGAHAGLALATSVAAYINAGLLWRHLRAAGMCGAGSGWRKLALQIGVANALMVAVLWAGIGDWQHWLQWTAMQRLSQLGIWIGAGTVVYVATLWLAGFRRSDWQQLMRHE